MQISGKIAKHGKFWVVECPTLQADTQGRSRKEALEMMKDWIWTALDDTRFPVEIEMTGDEEFTLTFSDPRPILGLIVQRTRATAGMTLDEVGSRLGTGRGRSYVKTYETGKHDPRFMTAQALVNAMGYDLRIEVVKRDDAPTSKPRVAKQRA
jgi:predicted RNase H-like HicB family nuclease